MAQTGLATAVGMTIERAFREAPLSLISGTNYNLGIATTNPHRFWTIDPGGGIIGKPDIDAPDGEIDGDVELKRTIKRGMSYEGSFSFKADAENLMYPLLGMFGRDQYSQIQSVTSAITAAMYRHVFTPNKYAPSFSLEEIFGDAATGRVTGGMTVLSLDLDFQATVMARMNVRGHRQVPNNLFADGSFTDYHYGSGNNIIPGNMSTLFGNGTNTWNRTPTPGYVDIEQEQPTQRMGSGPFTFAGMQYGTATPAGTLALGGAPDFTTAATAFISIDGVAVTDGIEILTGPALSLSRNITSQMIAGSGYDPGAATGNQFSASGRLPILFNDMTIYEAVLRHSRVSLNFRIFGIRPGVGGAKNYMLEVYVPNVRFLNVSGPISTDGPITEDLSWRARKDPNLGYSCLVMLQNQFDASQLAGEFFTGPTQALGYVGTLASATAVGTAVATFTTPIYNVVKNDIHVFTNASLNSGVGVECTVLSVNYTTGVVTYTANVGFIFPATSATVVTRKKTGGLQGWSNG
jgi:hypothetical protein